MIIPANGEGDALAYFVNKSRSQDLVLKLYKNDVAPSDADTEETYAEADFAGYAPIALNGDGWAISEKTADAPSMAKGARCSFTSSRGPQSQQIFGWYMVRAESGRIAGAERLAEPVRIANMGDVIHITPQISCASMT